MTLPVRSIFTLIVLAPLVLAACGGPPKPNPYHTNTTTTIGQELTDLKQAYDKGLITRSEYEKTRQAILTRYDK